jgi:hypothetical protein
MNEGMRDGMVRLEPTVYYAETTIDCSLDKAWMSLLRYESWNPTFANAEVVRVAGDHRSEGELVQIRKMRKDVKGDPLPEFFALTVKVVPRAHIVWYVYPKEGSAFRNFVDFGISEAPSGVKFNIRYYAQDALSGELLQKQRTDYEAGMHRLAAAFKQYCES